MNHRPDKPDAVSDDKPPTQETSPLYLEAYGPGDKRQGRLVARSSEGVFSNPDGSEVERRRGPDGVVRPIGITFTDGSSERYHYDASGQVVGWTKSDSQGRDLLDFASDDGKVFYNRLNPQQRLEGKITIHPDGSSTFIENNGDRIFNRTDGKVDWRLHGDGGREKHLLVNQDGSWVQLSRQPDGAERPVLVHHVNGLDTRLNYSPEGRLSDVSTYLPPGEHGGVLAWHYATYDGAHWWDKTGQFPPIDGQPEVDQDGTYTFNYSDGGQAVLSTDGSCVVSHIEDDDAVHVTNIYHASGSESQYAYDSNGSIVGDQEWSAPLELGGVVTADYRTGDGLHWSDSLHKWPEVQGHLTVDDQGNHVFHFIGQAHNATFIRKPDGKQEWRDDQGNLIPAPSP